jgi:hypothetical protein
MLRQQKYVVIFSEIISYESGYTYANALKLRRQHFVKKWKYIFACVVCKYRGLTNLSYVSTKSGN